MISIPRCIAAALLGLSLASCGGSEEETDTQILTAEGKILEGSISDDMLQYDTLQSQAPLAKIQPVPKPTADSNEEGPANSSDSPEPVPASPLPESE